MRYPQGTDLTTPVLGGEGKVLVSEYTDVRHDIFFFSFSEKDFDS